MGEFIEFGTTGLIPLGDGWFRDVNTGFKISPHGVIYNAEGQEVKADEGDDDEPSDG